MKKLLQGITTALLGAFLVTGVAAAQSGTIDGTGTGSTNKNIFHDTTTQTLITNNRARGSVNNDQDARSGRVSANGNTTVGDVSSGNASNSSNTSVSVTNSNASANALALSGWGGGSDASGSISDTGTNSRNINVFRNTSTNNVTATNSARVTSSNDQDATSGRVSANGNTTVGNVSSGDASNTSTQTVSIDQHN
jgi:hypothetical protein